MGILALTLGFTFNNPLGTLGVMVFASATFAAIILALNVWLGSVGQFLGLVLMVLQLVTAGGTFPWQTLPAPLAALHHVLPLGYVVDAMRQLMYGGNLGRAGWDLVVLGHLARRRAAARGDRRDADDASAHAARPAAEPDRLIRSARDREPAASRASEGCG